MKDFPKINLV
jgi:hypothetical protein